MKGDDFMKKEELEERIVTFSEKFPDDDLMGFFKEVSHDYEENSSWESKFEEMKKKYIERFFTSEEEIKDSQRRDNKEDLVKLEEYNTSDSPRKYEDLFESRVGEISLK